MPALTDLSGGQASMMFAILPETMPLVERTSCAPSRSPPPRATRSYPDIPTVAESGVPGYELIGWYGFLVPARRRATWPPS